MISTKNKNRRKMQIKGEVKEITIKHARDKQMHKKMHCQTTCDLKCDGKCVSSRIELYNQSSPFVLSSQIRMDIAIYTNKTPKSPMTFALSANNRINIAFATKKTPKSPMTFAPS